MSLIVAIPFGVGSAMAYGASTAVQHAAAHTGSEDPRGLLRLLRDPRWLMSIGGDTFGFGLQVVALSNGPVVLIQPLLVLTLPVSLFFSSLLTGVAPRRGDYLACMSIFGGLTVFFLILGTPTSGHLPSTKALEATVATELVLGGLVCWVARSRRGLVRAGMYGAVAGAWFGTLGVLLNSIAVEYRAHGARGLFTHADGLVPVVGLIVLGLIGMVLTQLSFQVGALAASFPANKAADPVCAVILGAVLLREHVPTSPIDGLIYVLCLSAIILGAVRLAQTSSTSAADRAVAQRPACTG